jgi:uncharacterized membrane protein
MSKQAQSMFELPSLVRFYLARIRERLWIKPLMSCVLSIGAVMIAGIVDGITLGVKLPNVSAEALETMLTIMSSSMLVIATFAVGSMISAYASASGTATPRAFPLIVADDVSQIALSTFIGAFIFSIVGLAAQLNGYYTGAGRFVLFIITLFVFSIVVLAFVRWVDRIARLGRLGHTTSKVETAADAALQEWANLPRMGAMPIDESDSGFEIYTQRVGYIQNINFAKLQRLAEKVDGMITVCSEPGMFVTPNLPLARFIDKSASTESASSECTCIDEIKATFVIGPERTFESDPRFGMVVMSEIASRALSSAVNDPGTAINIIGSLVRMLSKWSGVCQENEAAGRASEKPLYDRVALADLSADDLFNDAFTAIVRDGAGSLEVCIRIQKAFLALSSIGDEDMANAASRLSDLAFRYAEKSLILDEEIEIVRSYVKQLNDIKKHSMDSK